MKAMSRLLLPDVGELPLEVIAELRDKLRDSLDPMRAEMLRLSEDLRKAASVATKADQEHMLHEAEELISTRVEPAVRVVSARAQALAKSKWRKFFVGLAKAFGFAGAGLLDHALLTKALEEVLSAGAAFMETKEENSTEPAKASATFVIEARRVINEHGSL